MIEFAAASDPSPSPSPEAGSVAALMAEGRARQERVARLSDEIARLSAHIQAATGRLLVMIRQFDVDEGWHLEGFTSCARWLSWRTGLSPGAAREKVRVARVLGELPALEAALGTGEISYSAARALTRVATPENEAELLEVARHATAAELERLVGAWRASDRAEALAAERERHAERDVWLVPTDDGGWRIGGRLDGEAGAVLQKALEAAGEALYRSERGRAEDGTGADRADGAVAADERPSAGARWADALGLVAEAALGQGLGAAGGGTKAAAAGDAEAPDGDDASDGTDPPVVGRAGRFEVVVHVAAETLAAGTDAAETGDAGEGVPAAAPEPGEGVSAETPYVAGGPRLVAETARRLACDAGLVAMVHGRRGEVLDVGRRTRAVPPALRRALDHRDRGCRFPGCGSRFCDAHHIVPWAEGGETTLDNLVLLCRRHHRRVHEDGWRVERVDEGNEGRPGIRVRRPDGRILPRVPDRPPAPEDPAAALEHAQRGLGIDAWTATPRTDGVPMDVDWALFTLHRAPLFEAG